ncbi:MAG: 23S rRNA (pseudouridine(1915)-N(3))-methyltransferase RlmH [Rhizobiaceae bacterium]|nr:23S rRNA (pseudouridine(1915)-N(3))-methyltransferase RlmH [Rhizobiaceae bacterium]
MRLQILAVGKMKAGPDQELYARYADRISKSGKGLHLNGPELVEIPESRQSDVAGRKADEASLLLEKCDDGARIFMLDEHGKDLTSVEFSNLIRSEQESGTGTLAFAIGGPDGHGEALADKAVRKIRFGAMTWPHQIARILLAEQVYRAMTILSGHPYHRV